MKWMTEWWGIQIIAETEEDEKLLKELKNKLSDKAITHYEDGLISEPKVMLYDKKEIKAKYILQFDR